MTSPKRVGILPCKGCLLTHLVLYKYNHFPQLKTKLTLHPIGLAHTESRDAHEEKMKQLQKERETKTLGKMRVR